MVYYIFNYTFIMSKKHTVQKGDTLWAIAKNNNISLDELYRLNPNINSNSTIFPGDEITLTPELIQYDVDLRQERLEESIANNNNITAIQKASHDRNYVIVDKKNKLLSVYDKHNKLIYQTDEISTGLSGDDYNTITYVDANGHIKHGAGNNSTPAGITTIRNVGLYHGSPSFIRQRMNRDGSYEDIASSIHLGNTNNRLSSNGCIRASAQALSDLSSYVGSGTKVYTLPEHEDKSKFTIKGGKLNFTANNPYGKRNGDKQYWDDYNTHIDRSYTPLKITYRTTGDKEYDDNKKKYVQSVVNNKKYIQKEFNLSSDEYNRIAELALGIAQQESKYGTSIRYKGKEKGKGLISLYKSILKGGLKEGFAATSHGITQIKYASDNSRMQQFYNKHNINYETLRDPEVAALATIGRLAQIYRDEVRGGLGSFTDANGNPMNMEDVLLYKYNGRHAHVNSGNANPANNEYLNNIKNFARRFNMYETRTREQYKTGGSAKRYLSNRGQID